MSVQTFPFSAAKPVTENCEMDERTNGSILGHIEEDPRMPNKSKCETQTSVDPHDGINTILIAFQLQVYFLVAWPFLLGTICWMIIVISSHVRGCNCEAIEPRMKNKNQFHFLNPGVRSIANAN